MKNLFAVLLSLCAISCVAEVKDNATSDEATDNTQNNDVDQWYDDDQDTFPCSQVAVEQIEFNGEIHWISIPNACDPITYIYKGDPAPDATMIVPREEILSNPSVFIYSNNSY